MILGPTRYVDAVHGGAGYTFDLWDLDGPNDGGDHVKRIPLTFFAHGFTFHPSRPTEAALFEKHGPGSALVDLASQTVTRVLRATPGFQFYGHGTYTNDAAQLLAVESHPETGEGQIAIFDATGSQPFAQFPSYGSRPHDCTLVDGGKTLVITNGGGTKESGQIANVAFVDVATQRLLESIEIPEPSLNAGHIAITPSLDFAVVSAPRHGLPELTNTGGVSIRSGKNPLRTLAAPAGVVRALVGETLSVSIHEKLGIVAATTPNANLVTFWNLHTRQLINTLSLESARGVTTTLDDTLFAISYGANATLCLVDPKTQEVVEPAVGHTHFSGSHLFSWSYPAASS